MNTSILAACMCAAIGFSGIAAAQDRMSVSGAQLNMVSIGQGTPVVFVHGSASDMRVWEEYRDAMMEGYRFVAYDRRYFGPGEWPDDGSGYSENVNVADLIEVIEGLDAGPVHLVTWSSGGNVGVNAMLRRPDLFLSAVHFEPVLFPLLFETPGGSVALTDLRSTFGPTIDAMKDGRAEESIYRFIEAVLELPDGSAPDEPAAPMWRDNARTIVLDIGNTEPPLPVSCDDLSKSDVPTLVVQGAETFPAFSIMAEKLVACVRNGEIATLDAVNHDGPTRKPSEFAAMIVNFVTTVDKK